MTYTPTKLFNKWFIICVMVNFMFGTGFYITVPLLAQYVVELGASTAMAGFVAGIFSVMGLVFRPFSGYAADRFSRKKLVLTGFVLYALSFFGYAWAPSISVLIALRIMHAFGLCCVTTGCTVMMMEFVPKENTAEGVGYLSMAMSLATALGPTIGVMLLSFLDYQLTFSVSGVVMCVVILAVLPLPVAPMKKKPSSAKLSINSFVYVPALPLMMAAAAFAFCNGLTASFIVLVATQRAIAGVSLFFLISSLGAVITRPWAGRVVDRKGLAPIMRISFASEALTMVLCAFATSTLGIVLAGAGRVFGQMIGQSALQGQVMRDAPDENRGVANATFYMGIDIGQGAGAMLGGVIAGIGGFTASYLSALVMLVIGLAFYLMYRKRTLKKTSNEQAK